MQVSTTAKTMSIPAYPLLMAWFGMAEADQICAATGTPVDAHAIVRVSPDHLVIEEMERTMEGGVARMTLTSHEPVIGVMFDGIQAWAELPQGFRVPFRTICTRGHESMPVAGVMQRTYHVAVRPTAVAVVWPNGQPVAWKPHEIAQMQQIATSVEDAFKDIGVAVARLGWTAEEATAAIRGALQLTKALPKDPGRPKTRKIRID